MARAITFTKKAWKEGKKVVIAVPRCLWGELDFSKPLRVTIEELEGDNDGNP